MISLFLSFFSLYLATLLMSLGTGLYNTFIALHLTHQGVSEVWI
ncbi:MAG: MFS transporter, partial [Advenella sp.]